MSNIQRGVEESGSQGSCLRGNAFRKAHYSEYLAPRTKNKLYEQYQPRAGQWFFFNVQ